jgi:transcription initiation factor IIF auxiliary subunit
MVSINNCSKSIGKQRSHEFFRWRVFVDESPDVLSQIKEVEYLLHPTFPEPQQVRSSPETKFSLETSGWGEFPIRITIRYKDGREEHTKYSLILDPSKKPWPLESP